MVTTKLVVRVMDSEGQLLAWCEVRGEARGDGALWAPGAYPAVVERDGTPAVMSIHWADVNVEARHSISHAPVSAGQIITLRWDTGPIFVVGPMPPALPPVTVRGAVSIAMPVGRLGAVAH